MIYVNEISCCSPFVMLCPLEVAVMAVEEALVTGLLVELKSPLLERDWTEWEVTWRG